MEKRRRKVVSELNSRPAFLPFLLPSSRASLVTSPVDSTTTVYRHGESAGLMPDGSLSPNTQEDLNADAVLLLPAWTSLSV